MKAVQGTVLVVTDIRLLGMIFPFLLFYSGISQDWFSHRLCLYVRAENVLHWMAPQVCTPYLNRKTLHGTLNAKYRTVGVSPSRPYHPRSLIPPN